ncbi:MAG: hypothetical protein HQ572_02935 [Candidatus Omnitrophica bacterium]|nr:hypothetical protein [Candidatus Omnitrophota bacterium]
MRVFNILFIAMMIMATAAANAEAGVLVTPDRHILELSPGEEKAVEYQIYNSGPDDLHITVDPKAWAGTKDTRFWISLKEDMIELKANDTKPLKVTVTAPADVKGEMLAMLFLCYKESEDSALNIRNGIPLYLIIEGTKEYGAEIKDVGLIYKKEAKKKDLNLDIEVQNTGNVHIVPDIKVSITDEKDKEVKRFVLEEAKTLLRGQDHTFSLIWRYPGLSNGDYKVVAEIVYGDKLEKIRHISAFSFKDGDIKVIKDGA